MNSGKRRQFFHSSLSFHSSSFSPGSSGKNGSSTSLHTPTEARLVLREGWSLQTSAKVEAKLRSFPLRSLPRKAGCSDRSDHRGRGASQRQNLPDPYFGMNLRSLPGVNYPIGGNFSNIPMAPDSPYAVSWWYRKTFTVPASYKGKTVWLKFNGINYRANIWLNGKQIAKSDDVAGAWRTYEFNITKPQNLGRKTCLPFRCSLPPNTTWQSHSWIGTRRLPIRIWDCGARST